MNLTREWWECPFCGARYRSEHARDICCAPAMEVDR